MILDNQAGQMKREGGKTRSVEDKPVKRQVRVLVENQDSVLQSLWYME